MRYYFELPDGDHMRYLWADVECGDQSAASRALSYGAHRIWREREDGAVNYIKLKSPWISDMIQVDMREFFWVKLQSQPYNRSHS